VEPAEILKVTPASFDSQFNVNLKAALIVSQIVAKKMIERGQGGSIVNISSIGGQRPLIGVGLYCCTKSALEMLTKSLALELGPYKIRVNSLNPAFVMTDINTDKEGKEKLNELHSSVLQRTPTQHVWMPMSDVVKTVLFLASNSTSQITGQSLSVDGGYLAH